LIIITIESIGTGAEITTTE